MAARKQINPFLKLALEIGPLVVFFLANGRAGIFVATALFMGAVLVSLVASYALTRHLPIMPIVTAVVVLIFGGLTLLLQDDHFIKLKPTIVNLLFAGALFGGLLLNKPLLKIVLDAVFDLTDEGWRKLTLRWALFFLFLAALNEVVWRNFSTDTWVSFKVFGVMPLTFVFALAQVPLLQRYAIEPTDAAPPAEG
jgi:intracellular septation protein